MPIFFNYTFFATAGRNNVKLQTITGPDSQNYAQKTLNFIGYVECK